MARPGRNVSSPATPPRVAFVLHSAARDGAAIAFLELIDALPADRFDIVSFLPGGGPLACELTARGVPWQVVPYRWWMDRGTPTGKKAARTLWNAVLAVSLARRLRVAGAALVYSNSLAVGAGAVAARLLRLPHLWHAHELWGAGTGFAFDLGERMSLGLVDRLSVSCIAVSHALESRLAAFVDAAKVHTVYQSVTIARPADLPPAPPRSEGRCACAIVGALYPLRRQEDALRAFALLARDGLDADLWLAGGEEPDYGRRLRLLAGELGLTDRVRFLGYVDDPVTLLGAADVALSCTPVEGFGRATVQAMLVGRPVVASSGGANDELLADGRGVLYAAGDAADLARCMGRLLRDPVERRRLSARARVWADGRFTRERYGREMVEVLKATMSPQASSAGSAE